VERNCEGKKEVSREEVKPNLFVSMFAVEDEEYLDFFCSFPDNVGTYSFMEFDAVFYLSGTFGHC
jgi:hypothetical protein